MQACFQHPSTAAAVQVVIALSQRAGHVSYRSSKLTHLLKDSIGGNCRTLLVACAWSEVRAVLPACELGCCAILLALHKLKRKALRLFAAGSLGRLQKDT